MLHYIAHSTYKDIFKLKMKTLVHLSSLECAELKHRQITVEPEFVIEGVPEILFYYSILTDIRRTALQQAEAH